MAGESILIIEDNASNLKLFTILLTIEGYEVRSASNANDALNILSTYKPKLILLDIQLPDIDGFTLARKLKNDPLYKDIIIIAITAYAMKGDREKAIEAGCDDYIPKPIDPKTFTKIVTRNIHKIISL